MAKEKMTEDKAAAKATEEKTEEAAKEEPKETVVEESTTQTSPTGPIEALLKDQARHNKKMLLLSRIRTVAAVTIAAVILTVVLMVASLVNAVADDIQGIVDLASQFGDAGAFLDGLDLALLDDLGNLDMAMLEETIAKIDQLDFDSLQENMEILGESLRAVQELLEEPRLY